MPVWRHLNPEQVGKGRERKKINIVVLFLSYPTRNRKFQKNSKKIKKYHYGIISSLKISKKIKKYHYGIISSLKQFGKGQEREKIKIIVSFRSFLTRYRKFQKNRKEVKSKIKKTPLWHHFKPKQFATGKEREKIKIIVSFRPYLTHN